MARKKPRTPTAYRATIHTAELEIMPHGKRWGRWVSDTKKSMDAGKMPFIDGIWREQGKPTLILNPHKRYTDEHGKFIFEYWNLDRYRKEVGKIIREIGADDYTIRRLDIALDSVEPYEHTAKLIRACMLSLGDVYGLENSFYSVDAFTGEGKTLRGDNYREKAATVQFENYNRATVDQSRWNATIVNRLELRAMGEQAGIKHDEQAIVKGWKARLLTAQDNLPAFIEKQSELLFEKWIPFSERRGRNTTNALNAFVILNERHIYTRDQLKQFLGTVKGTDGEGLAKRFRERWGNFVELYSLSEYQREAGAMHEALERFTEEE